MGPKKAPNRKNSPEMNELERDLIPVKILAKNIEKQKKYIVFAVPKKKNVFFWLSGTYVGNRPLKHKQ